MVRPAAGAEEGPFRAYARPGIHPRVARLLADVPRGRLLDLPSGSGALAWRLHEAGFTVTAADLRPELCEVPGLEAVRADLDHRFPFPDGAFDAATFVEGPEHAENPHAAFREFARVLRPGGLLVTTLPNYGNIEKRLKFVFDGGREKPVTAERLAGRLGGDPNMMHRSPMDYVQVRQALEQAGFVLERVVRDRLKVRQLLLLPLAILVWLVTWVRGRRGRERRWLDETNSRAVLMGGNTLIITARRT